MAFYIIITLFFIIMRSGLNDLYKKNYDIYLNMCLIGTLFFTIVIINGAYIELTRFSQYFHISTIFLWAILFKNHYIFKHNLSKIIVYIIHICFYYIYISKIGNHYKKIAENFLDIFKQIKYYWQLKEIIHKLENPILSFHYKLLNTFSRAFLEKFVLEKFDIYTILNIVLLKNKIDRQNISQIFLPNYSGGFYINGIEISVDLDDSDFAIIEDDSGVITTERFFEIINE